MSRNKKIAAAVLIFLMILAASTIQKKEILVLDEDSYEIEIKYGQKTIDIKDREDVRRIVDKIVEDSKKTKKDSVNDYPNDTDEIYSLRIISPSKQDQLFIYNKNKKYFIERPYEGIYTTNKKVFDMIGEEVKQK